jgi:uncharacterized protein YcsI (UPF0317 family)
MTNFDPRPWRHCTPAALRAEIRSGRWTGPTAGCAAYYVQTNVVIVPASSADDFEQFCRLNAQACPLVERTAPGDPCPRRSAPDGDLRTDVPRYRVFRHGVRDEHEPTEISGLWRDDFVSFLLGCSFTFESALEAAGLPVRHVQLGTNVPMYRTNLRCEPSGPFQGDLVVSMRPFRSEQVDLVHEVTCRYPRMHGSPVHIGAPSQLGIRDLAKPDFGDPPVLHVGEIPVFWACGVTPQLALEQARLDLAVTHSPGCMFVTDLRDEQFCTMVKP